MKSRRSFIKTAGAGILASGILPLYASGTSPENRDKHNDLFSIAMAGYTFKEFSAEETIVMMKRIDVKNISLKDFHLPLNSSKDEISEIIKKFNDNGIRVYGVGVVYMKSRESVDIALEYAVAAGVDVMVCAPDYELLPYIQKKMDTGNFKLAIHNHGPDNPLYPNASDIWNHIKDLDPRIGICIDVGHTVRDGKDPSEDIEKYADRIYDVHIKDVDKASKEGKTVEMGRGIIDLPKVLGSLRKINFGGKCALEFEKDMKDPLAGISESIGYLKGILSC